MLEKPNYKFNKNMPMPDRFINGQALGMVSRLRYGLFPMSYNGCEIIAVYNYMRLHGVKTNMADLALEIYPKGSVLMGLFGSNPYMLRHYFQKRGMSEHGITDYERFKREFPKASSAIISFWIPWRSRAWTTAASECITTVTAAPIRASCPDSTTSSRRVRILLSGI